MTNLRDLKNRQRTTHLIKRMTGAMGMIARARYMTASGLHRHNALGLESLQQLASHLWQQAREQEVPLPSLCSSGSPDLPWLLVVLSSQSGLCGGFNTQIIARAKTWLAEQSVQSVPPLVLFVGKKGRRALEKDSRWHPVGLDQDWHAGRWIEYVRDQLCAHTIRGASVLYSRYVNAIKQEPWVTPVLPLSFESCVPVPEDSSSVVQWHVEPNMPVVLDAVADRLYHTWCQVIETEHQLSEHAARMQAMNTAHDNAKDMLQSLQIQYNRLRQDRITKELIEIVAGSQNSGA